MIGFQRTATKATFTKNFVTDQTMHGILMRLNVGNLGFDVSKGFGRNAAETSSWFHPIGGFNDQSVSAVLRFGAATSAGAESIGVVFRCVTFETTANYYLAWCHNGFAVLSKIVNGSFTTLVQTAFALAQDTDVTISVTAVGSSLSATFSASGGSPANVTITATDSTHSNGFMGVTSITSSIWCKSFTASQV